MFLKNIFIFTALLHLPLYSAQNNVPPITIVCVIDQFAEHLCSRHYPFLKGGIRKILDQGTQYTHAFYPHAQPETAVGHTALATGTIGSIHGIVSNEWFEHNKKVQAFDDPNHEESAVISPDGYYEKGKSTHNLKTTVLSTSCCLHEKPFNVLSFSLKNRAAIPLAGPLGFPTWFDSRVGLFTSSKAFYETLPVWTRVINRYLQQTLHTTTKTEWNSLYPEDSSAYQHVTNESYQHTSYPFSLVNNPQPLNNSTKAYYLYQQTPAANKTLLLLSRLALHLTRKKEPLKPIVLWISLSSLDYVGHYYGPNSIETIDMLYHIDRQLGTFIKAIEREYGASNCLWALTSDHGVMPIAERMHEEGNYKAQRLDTNVLLKSLNRALYDSFNIKKLLTTFQAPHLYVDEAEWALVDDETRPHIISFIKTYLTQTNGITHAWHEDDFHTIDFAKTYGSASKERWSQDQFYKGRSGNFVVQVAPYTMLTSYPKGTSHDSPYDYDTRVPLAFYGPTRIKKRSIHTPLSMLHFPTTLAHLLGVPRPTHAPARPLPLLM